MCNLLDQAGASGTDEYYVLLTGLNFNGEETPHSPLHPFCLDPRCPCKEDPEAIQLVASWIHDGVLTTREADLFFQGKTF